MKIKFLLSAFLTVTFFATANAQIATPKVKERQVHQQKRIRDGIKDGELTKKEVYHLEKQQARIHKAKHRAKADGEVTDRERASLHARQSKASHQIHHQKTDRQERN